MLTCNQTKALENLGCTNKREYAERKKVPPGPWRDLKKTVISQCHGFATLISSQDSTSGSLELSDTFSYRYPNVEFLYQKGQKAVLIVKVRMLKKIEFQIHL